MPPKKTSKSKSTKHRRKKKFKKHKQKNEGWQGIIDKDKRKKVRRRMNDLCRKNDRTAEETKELHSLWGGSQSFAKWSKNKRYSFNKYCKRTKENKPKKYRKVKNAYIPIIIKRKIEKIYDKKFNINKINNEKWRLNICNEMGINYWRKDQPKLCHTSVQRFFDARDAEYKLKVKIYLFL